MDGLHMNAEMQARDAQDVAITNGGTAASTPASAARSSDVDSLPVREFLWGAGVECSFLPHLNVDQYAWTQHDRFWRDDLRRAKTEAGITSLRYAFPWHILEPQRGRFDW